jgi:acyl-CoA dehydrogenase
MSALYFNTDHDLFRQTVRQFMDTSVTPYINEWEKNEQIPREVWLKMGELGFLGINYPEQYGGTAADFFYSVVFLEEICRCGAAGFGAAVSVHQYMATAHLAEAGSHSLKQRYLAPAISGEKIAALGVTEPGAGSDVANLQTTAKREGDYYIINGAKTFITNGYYADFITLACRTGAPESGIGGISLIIVDCNSAGVSRSKLQKMGWHSSDTGELFFDNVRVPVHNLIGEEGHGFYYIMDSFQLERLSAGITSIAGADYAIDITIKYMHERQAFGRPIAKFQTLRHDIVNLAAEVRAAKYLTYHAAWQYGQGKVDVAECSMVKLLTTELAKKTADVCLQCFGGYGFMDEYPISRYYRDARVGTIVGGTSQIMREILAKIIIDDKQYKRAYTHINKQNNVSLHAQNQQQSNEALSETSKNEPNTTTQPQQIIINPQQNQHFNNMSAPSTAREILRSLPSRLKAHKITPDYETNIHFNISGDNGGEFTVNIANGACTVADGLVGTPKCVITTKDSVYEGVELGKENPQMAVMMGKIKLTNIAEMMTFTGLFERLY